jgi:prepilin-type N-terminal cleavage/methylation domain-containing protein
MHLAPASRAHSLRGFTLIELTISAALMALILGAAYLCLHAGMSAQRLLDPRLEATQYARVALDRLTADLRGACPLDPGFEFIGLDRTLGDAEADNLDFATLNHTPRRPGEGDFCQTSYYVEPDARTGELVLWRRRNPRIGLDPFAGGTQEEIARGLRRLNFEYFDGLDWYDFWGDAEGRRQTADSNRLRTNLNGLPDAVRITIAFATTSPRGPPGGTAPGTESGAAEPPLVFQTIVRLPVTASSSGSSGATLRTEPIPGSSPTEGAPATPTR